MRYFFEIRFADLTPEAQQRLLKLFNTDTQATITDNTIIANPEVSFLEYVLGLTYWDPRD